MPKKGRERHLAARDLKKIEDILHKMKKEVVSELSNIQQENLRRNLRADSGELSSYTTHMADMASNEEELAKTIRMLAAEEDILQELDNALERIAKGKYGVCEGCGDPIGRARLKAVPFACLCIDCRQKRDTGR